MNGHVDFSFLAGGQDPLEEIHQIFEEPLPRNGTILPEQPLQFVGRIALVPARQMQIARVEAHQLCMTVAQRIRAVRSDLF